MNKKLSYIGLVAMTAVASMISFGCSKTEGAAKGQELFARCTNCHGENGEGKREILAPAIAGLPAWYIENQLEKYARGWRGGHLNDVAGHRMRPMARTLVRPSDSAKLVAAYVAQLPPNKPVDDSNGDAENGEALFAQCAACHGADGGGMPGGDGARQAMMAAGKNWVVPDTQCDKTFNFALANPWAPPLKNASSWYIVEQLKKFKSKWRGNHACDHLGKQMHQWAGNLSERDMTDIAAYVHTLSSTKTAGK